MRPLPSWVASVVERGAAPVPVHDVIRSALTVPLVLVVTYSAEGADAALFASIAALLVVLSERSGTLGQRALKTGAGLACGTLAMLAGPYSGGAGIVPLLVVLGFGLMGGILSGFGHALSFAGMQGIVQMSIAGGLAVDISTRGRVASYLCGGAIAFAIALAQSWLERTERLYQRALDDARDSLRAWGHTPVPGPAAAAARQHTDVLLVAARDIIGSARPRRRRRAARLAQLRADYSHLSVWVTSLIAGAALSPTGPVLTPPRVRDLIRAGLTRPATWDFVIRLEVCLAIGELARQNLPWGHSYWILLTIALSLKPDIGPVYPRTVQRALGTVVGVAIGWLAVVLSPDYPAVPVLVVLGAVVPITVRRNYGLFTVAITPMVLILMDLGQDIGPDVLAQRVASTLVGCVVVLTVGNAWWPSTRVANLERTALRLRRRIDDFPRSGAAHTVIAETRLELARDIAAYAYALRVRDGEPRRRVSTIDQRSSEPGELDRRLVQRVRDRVERSSRTCPDMNHPPSSTTT